MKSESLSHHFSLLAKQRIVFLNEVDELKDKLWKRPLLEKWSIGETLCHLILMVRLFRRFSLGYIPLMKGMARLRRRRDFPISIHNIYVEYNQSHSRAMEAPRLIKPKAKMVGMYSLTDLLYILQKETDNLRLLVRSIEEDIAGNIYYVDPVAGNPNLIQSIHLLAIHEQHHFDLLKQYYKFG